MKFIISLQNKLPLSLLVSLIFFQSLSLVPIAYATAKKEAIPAHSAAPVVLQLKWSHQFQFAGYYAAQHKGFFAQEGLRVKIKAGGPKVNVNEEVLSGNATYGVLASELIQKKAQGEPLVLLAVIMQHSIRTIIVRAESGINSPSMLVGRRIMLNRNEDTEFMAMFAAEGIAPGRLNITPKDTTAADKFINKEIDALNGSIGNQPFIFEKLGIPVITIRPINYGIDFYGDSLFTSETEVRVHPERVAAFRRATIKGWQYAMGHTSEMIDHIIAEYNPDKSREQLHYEAKAIRKLILPNLVDIGHINPHRIERIATTYAERNLVPEEYSLTGFIYAPLQFSHAKLFRRITFGSLAFFIILLACGGALALFNKRLKKQVALRTDELFSVNKSLLREIKIRERTKNELRESEAKLKVIFEQAAVGVAQIETKSGLFVRVNKKYCDICGYSPEEMTQTSFQHITHPDDLQEDLDNMKKLVVGDIREFAMDKRYIKKDGSHIWVNLNVSPMWGIGETPNYHIAIVEDISERKHFEQELSEKIDLLQIVLTNTPVLLSAIDLKGTFILSEGSVLERLGLRPGELIGKSIYEVFQKRPDIIQLGERAMAGESINTVIEMADIVFQTFFKPLRDDNNELKGSVILSINITDRLQAEKEKEHLQEQLSHSLKMEAIGTLAGGVAHDFNNILTAILGYADMALDDIPAWSPAKDEIEEVLIAGNRAKELVKHILAFSRKEAQERIPVKPQSLIIEVMDLLRASLPTTIHIQKDIDGDCGNILAEPTKIHQILMNLCTNAAHAMVDQTGVIKISLRQVELNKGDLINKPTLETGTYVLLSIQDNGDGIDPNIVERIFDPYFTTKEFGKGSGMGLAVVHGIVQSHDGMITVESAQGQGTTFNVFLPLIEEQVQIEVPQKEHLQTGTEKILLVDDEASVADVTKRRIELMGYRVTAMTNSIETLDLFRTKPDFFDLIITDQTMPGLSGEQLAIQALSIRPDIPIILCTGYSSRIDTEKADSIGIRAYFMKPIDKNKLAKTIRNVLDSPLKRKT